MNIMLVNYRHPSSRPYRSIMHLPRERAFEIADQLYKSSQCRAHKRFGPDFEFYYAYRLQVEQALYNEFMELGGKPQLKHPFYFVLEYCDAFYENFDHGVCVKLPLNEIDPFDISFTFGDSMAQFESDDRQPVFLVDTLYSYIKNYNQDIRLFLNKIIPKYKCIKAQLWTNKYFPCESRDSNESQ